MNIRPPYLGPTTLPLASHLGSDCPDGVIGTDIAPVRVGYEHGPFRKLSTASDGRI